MIALEDDDVDLSNIESSFILPSSLFLAAGAPSSTIAPPSSNAGRTLLLTSTAAAAALTTTERSEAAISTSTVLLWFHGSCFFPFTLLVGVACTSSFSTPLEISASVKFCTPLIDYYLVEVGRELL